MKTAISAFMEFNWRVTNKSRTVETKENGKILHLDKLNIE